MQSAYYRFEHSCYSRKGNAFHGPSGNRHLSAKSNYNTNPNKVWDAKDSIRINLPTDRHELYRALERHSRSVTRANGRLGESFLISFDVRMSIEDQREALARFMWRVSFNGRVQVAGDIHRDQPHNPHANVLLVDRDENGQPVGHFGRSASFRRENSPVKGNPTVWLRKVWNDEYNAVLEERGYNIRADMRSNLERGLEEAGKHRGPIPEMQLVSELPQQVQEAPAVVERPPEPDAEVKPEPVSYTSSAEDVNKTPESIHAPPTEEEMETIERLTPREAAILASEFYDDLRYARDLQIKLTVHSKAVETAEGQLQTAYSESAAAGRVRDEAEKKLFTAQNELARFQKENGKLKGLSIGIGKLSWKSPTRKLAEEAQATHARIEKQIESAEAAIARAAQQVERWENSAETQRLNLSTAQNQAETFTARFGDGATLEQAEATLKFSAHAYLSKAEVTKEDLLDLYETSQISTSQYRDALDLLGEREALAELEAKQDENLDERIELAMEDKSEGQSL